MNSRNQKQEELIRRLEEIRRQRSTIQTNETETPTEQPMRRNKHAGTPTRKNRNRNRQQSVPSRRNRKDSPVSSRRGNTKPASVGMEDQGQYSQETYKIGHQNDDISDARRIRQAKIREKLQDNEKKTQKVKTRKKQSNPLIDQLSNADKLSQAIVLSEIISKPIALRPKSR